MRLLLDDLARGDGNQTYADRVPQTKKPYRPGYELAAERILEMIVSRGLAPGDRLPSEQALAEQMGLSRSVTREAIKVLTAIGRVSAQRGRGLYVGAAADAPQSSLLSGHRFIPGDPDQVEQLLKFRLVQEVAAAREAALNATPPDLRVLRQAIADCDQALGSGDRDMWADADTRFHVGLAAASGNAFLRAAVESARRLQEQVVVLGLHGGTGGSLDEAQVEHRAIYAAVLTGEPDKAGQAAAQHIEHTVVGYRAEIAEVLAAPPAARNQ
jgi:GntR family transcriptional regulator, transcriptional repressor for pyruvate dehydrogenase complex